MTASRDGGPAADQPDNRMLIRRLFALAWRYRLHCLQVLGIQLVLLTLGIAGLGLTGIGVVHASEDDSCAADISLVGALDPTSPDADAITATLVGHLARPYRDDKRPLWFEVDTGAGTNEPLARLVTPRTKPVDEIVILTND